MDVLKFELVQVPEVSPRSGKAKCSTYYAESLFSFILGDVRMLEYTVGCYEQRAVLNLFIIYEVCYEIFLNLSSEG